MVLISGQGLAPTARDAGAFAPGLVVIDPWAKATSS